MRATVYSRCLVYLACDNLENTLPKRKNIRLKDFDYSQNGYYFITLCTHNRKHLFGEITNGEMELNDYDKIAEDELLQIPNRFSHTLIDKYVIMPNHIHCIVEIVGNGLDHSDKEIVANIIAERSRPFPTIPKILGLYKSGVSRRIHQLNNEIEIWQKSYYEHIVRNEQDYKEIYEYIENNPLKWELDKY